MTLNMRGDNSAGGYLGGRSLVNEFFHDVSDPSTDYYDGDIVDASGLKGLGDERSAQGFRVGGGFGNESLEILILNHLGETIGTEQEHILRFERFGRDVGIRFEAQAKRSGQHMALRMMERLGG